MKQSKFAQLLAASYARRGLPMPEPIVGIPAVSDSEMTATPTLAEKREAARFAAQLPANHVLRVDVVTFALLGNGEEISAAVYAKVTKAARAFAAL